MNENEQRKENHKPRFDGTVNLGHILTALAMVFGGTVVWTQSQVAQTRIDARVTLVERDVKSIMVTQEKTAENMQLALRTQDRMTLAVDALIKSQK